MLLLGTATVSQPPEGGPVGRRNEVACTGRAPTRSARPRSAENTYPASPASVLLASATASSSEEKVVTVATGPKISSRYTEQVGGTPVSTVGGKKYPRPDGTSPR